MNESFGSHSGITTLRLSRKQVDRLVDFIVFDYGASDYYWENFEKISVWLNDSSRFQVTRTEIGLALVSGGVPQVRKFIEKRIENIKKEIENETI